VARNRRLLASCWTWAGDAGPGGPLSSPVPWEQRVAAVGATGWEGVGLSHTDVADYSRAPGLTVLRDRLHSVGIPRVELEMLRGWWATGEERRRSDRTRDELLDAATVLGVDVIKVGAPQARGVPPHLLPPWDRFVQEFGALAERADGFGVNIALEGMSHTNLPTLSAAIDLVRQASHPRAGLALDVDQLVKCGDGDWTRLPGRLAGVPVFVVELGDAPVDPTVALDHGVGPRCLPGEGDLDIPGFIAAMRTAGWDGYWGVEIISDDLRVLPLDVGLRAVRTGIDRLFDVADALAG